MAADEKVKLVLLNPTSSEYKDVEKNVKSSAGNTALQIVKIERIQNPQLFKQYVTHKENMDRANPGKRNERVLWHRTDADALKSINETGFNRSYFGKKAAAYGRGVYFARDFAYSASATYYLPDANGVKYIYQCLVLTGEFTLGKRWLVDPPEKTNGEKYDSTVNNQAQPTVFVIYSDTQAYPQYLVSFK